MTGLTELADSLEQTREAFLEVTEESPVNLCRSRLIEAAQLVGVRITMKHERRDDGTSRVRAFALTREQALAHRQKDVLFRGINDIKKGVHHLSTSGVLELDEIDEEIEDLRDIIEALEMYANEIGSGATR